MRAAQVLSESSLDGEELRAVLHPVDPAEVRIRSAPILMRWLWRGDIAAMTLMRTVFVDPVVLAGDRLRLGRLMVHELVHVRQWADYGVGGFLRRYLGEYFRGRRQGLGHGGAYTQNRLEIEARSVTSRYT